jgi:hypothetical protein
MARRQKRAGNKEPPTAQLRIAVRFNDRVARVPKKVTGLEKFFVGAGLTGAELPLMPLIQSTAANDLVDRARMRDAGYAPVDFLKWCQVRRMSAAGAQRTCSGHRISIAFTHSGRISATLSRRRTSVG